MEGPKEFRITRSDRGLIGAIVRCVGCGMVWLPKRFAVADYEESADPYYARQASDRIRNAHRLLQWVPAGGRLLDVGCACGFLLVAARERGFEAEGIEPSAWATDYARRELGLSVRRGTLTTCDLAPEQYDVVVLADTLEHLTNPRKTLATIHRILREGGRLLLLTPDIGSAAARLAGRRWWALLDDHYFYFSRVTLRRILAGEGFEVERLAAFGREFPLSHWLFKLSQYSVALYRNAERAGRWLRVDRLRIRVNLGDQMACVARKK